MLRRSLPFTRASSACQSTLADLNKRIVHKFHRPSGSVKFIYGIQTVVAQTRSEGQDKYERIKQCIPLEGTLAQMSGHFGLDFSKMDLDAHVQNLEVPGIQGLFDSIIYVKDPHEKIPVTVKEAALIYAQRMGMPVLVGTPEDIANPMELFMNQGGADEFMLAAMDTPGCFEEFVDLVVPELQRRTAYHGKTLRENRLSGTAGRTPHSPMSGGAEIGARPLSAAPAGSSAHPVQPLTPPSRTTAAR